MKKIGIFIDKYKGKFWFSFTLNLLILLLMLIFMLPTYETNDDIAIRQFVNGSREVRDPHLVHQNILLGFLYKFFYGITISLPWYEIVQYLVLLVSLTAVTYVLLNSINKKLAFLLTALFLVFFAFECYIRPQYTKTAGVAAAAGLFLLFHTLRMTEKRRSAQTAAIALVCFGFMYRNIEAGSCMLMMAALALYFFLSLRKNTRAFIKQQLLKFFRTFGVLALCLVTLQIVDFCAYEINPEWKSYKEFNLLRTDLLDYGFPDYASNAEAYGELGD